MSANPEQAASQSSAARIGRWIIPAIPFGWTWIPDFGIQRGGENAVPSNVYLKEDEMLAGGTSSDAAKVFRLVLHEVAECIVPGLEAQRELFQRQIRPTFDGKEARDRRTFRFSKEFKLPGGMSIKLCKGFRNVGKGLRH